MSQTVEALLRDFRDRRIGYSDFEEQMRPWLEIGVASAGFSIRYRQAVNAQVPITPSDVRRALAAFAAGKLSERDLVLWATMLDMLTEFGPGADVADAEAEQLEPMWEIIIRLASPRLFGDLTPETIESYDKRLRQLETDLANRAV